MSFQPMVFRPVSNIVLAITVLAFCGLGVVATAIQGNPEYVWRSIAPIALLGALAIAAFWLPKIDVQEHGIIVRNVFSTVLVPWETILSIETRWSLAFHTEAGKIRAWASPGREQSVGMSFMMRGMTVPGTTRIAGTPERPANERLGVARHIQNHWDGRIERNEPGDPDARPVRRINVVTIAVLAGLAVASVVGLLV